MTPHLQTKSDQISLKVKGSYSKMVAFEGSHGLKDHAELNITVCFLEHCKLLLPFFYKQLLLPVGDQMDCNTDKEIDLNIDMSFAARLIILHD
jgi:hypothetical protein